MPKFNTFLIALFLFLFSSKSAIASIVSIKPDGVLVWKVLSDESVNLGSSSNSFIEVKKVTDQVPNKDSKISLVKSNGKVNLVVSSANETRELNIQDGDKELIEIEERPQTQKVVIGLKSDEFVLEQNGISAKTILPINIDAKNSLLSVLTSSGENYLTVLPQDAAQSALRSKLVTNIEKENMEISEVEGGLQYKILGEKIFNVLNLYQYKIPMTVYISASTGEVLNVDSTTWFKYLRFWYI